jgi:flagellar biosynthetic protein FliP
MVMNWGAGLPVLLAADASNTVDNTNLTPYGGVSFTGYFITLAILLVIVVLMGYLSAKLKNRGALPKINLPFKGFGGLIKTNREIKVVERYMLEPRKSLYIINVGTKNWLLASSENNLQVISEVNLIDENENAEEVEQMNSDEKIDLAKSEDKGKNFSDYLNLPIILPLICFLFTFLVALPVFAQSNIATPNFLDSIDLREPMKLKELGTPLQLIIFMAFLTLLPFFFIMTTSFMRTIIVLGFLRQAIGTQQVPPNQVIMGISVFLTIYIMSPVWGEVNEKALTPYFDNKISQSVAWERGVPPIRNFMLKYTKKEELSFFMRMVKLPQPKNADDVPIHVLIPAYMVSELSTGFKIGFFLFLPFLVVDLVVANTLLALGMMMLSPVTISMPFKLLVFTLANGWYLVLQALVTSFRM